MSAKRDQNKVPTAIAALNSDGVTIVNLSANASAHLLMVDDNTTGSDNGTPNAKRDENSVPILMAVSSADGQTPVALYATSNGSLLVDSN